MAEGNANPQKKTYTNKNIKKLRTVSLVCGLTSSWQRWVSDNETKQAKEPSGWAPSWLDPDTEPKKTWTPKKIEEDQTTEDDKERDAKDQRKREETRGTEQDEEEEEDKEEEEEEESVMKIKRPSSLLLKKESDDANKINALSKRYSAVGSLKSRWQDWASEHTVNQRLNPFSEYFDYNYSMSTRLVRGQEGYGRPKEGTKTAERAKRAEQHIHREIADMCLIIRTMAKPDGDGKTRVTFGELFDRYVRISDKVVGILMRARKHGKVAFEGEMLWQGRDDGVIITLLV
uniref:Actin-binding Rho-activating protein n=1 Tax=Knipowitschia caucasica TaxID=637954 RepID=A0AAV2K0V1_KNICA